MTAKHTGSPLSLEERLHRLGDNLQALRSQLQEAIARAVSEEVASAVRDAIRTLFEHIPQREPAQPHSGGWDSYEEEDPWSDQPWLGEQREGFHETEGFRPQRSSPGGLYRPFEEPPLRRQESRQTVLTEAMKLSLGWARKRPLLAAAVLAAALGGAAYFGGPALVGNAAAVASLVGLAMTAQNAPDALARLIENSMI